MVQIKKIKQEGVRKEIPDVASPQPEGITTTATLKRGEKASFDLQFNFEQKGKRKQWVHKKKSKR